MPNPAKPPRTHRSGLRATTIRFGGDLWAQLEAEADRLGVSVAQYVRDAALIRVTWEALRRDGRAYQTAITAVEEPGGDEPARRAREATRELREETRALRAEARQASRRSRALGESITDGGESEGEQDRAGPRPA